MGRLRQLWTWTTRLARFTWRVLAAFLHNRGLLLAGGVGYNILLSLVPFLTIAVALLSLFFEEDQILDNLRPELRTLVPQNADALVQAADTFLHNRGAGSAVSMVVLVFFSSIAFRMLEEAVAAIFHVAGQGRRRSFWKSALLPYTFLSLLMVALFLVTLFSSAVEAVGDRVVHLGRHEVTLAQGLAPFLDAVGFFGLVLLFAAIYRVLPVVRIANRRALFGGLAAAVLWRLVGGFMNYYFANLSMVNLVYGSLATVVIVLLLMEVACIILLLGAQVIAELEASNAAGLHWYEAPPAPPQPAPV